VAQREPKTISVNVGKLPPNMPNNEASFIGTILAAGHLLAAIGGVITIFTKPGRTSIPDL